MRLPAIAFALLCFASPAFAAGSAGLVNEMAVSVVNKSQPDLCADWTVRDGIGLVVRVADRRRCRRPPAPFGAGTGLARHDGDGVRR